MFQSDWLNPVIELLLVTVLPIISRWISGYFLSTAFLSLIPLNETPDPEPPTKKALTNLWESAICRNISTTDLYNTPCSGNC